MIAVTFALPVESSDFISLLEGRSREKAITRGVLHGTEICVVHTGVGERAARAVVGRFFERETPELLISAGFAGALVSPLPIGGILVARNFSAPAALQQARAFCPDATFGRLATARTILDSAADREALRRRTDALAVDMETEAIAAACAQRAVPMLALRAISDSPAQPFPMPPGILFDIERQKTSCAALILYLLRHPWAIGRLLAFARQVSVARGALASALGALVRGRAAS